MEVVTPNSALRGRWPKACQTASNRSPKSAPMRRRSDPSRLLQSERTRPPAVNVIESVSTRRLCGDDHRPGL